MHQTLKHIAIFLLFLVTVLLWDRAGGWLERSFFAFRYGKTMFLFTWATCVVILFHLLYHYLGRCGEKTVYLVALVVLGGLAALVYFGHLRLA